MISAFDLGRHSSKLLALFSVLGLFAVMAVSTLG